MLGVVPYIFAYLFAHGGVGGQPHFNEYFIDGIGLRYNRHLVMRMLDSCFEITEGLTVYAELLQADLGRGICLGWDRARED